MKHALLALGIVIATGMTAQANLVISQYIDTDSGTTPKAVEFWNISGATIDFTVTPLSVNRFANGGTSPTNELTLNMGTLSAGAVFVVGDASLRTTTEDNGAQFIEDAWFFNGDDALVVSLDGTTTDVFGTVGDDPGTAWTGSGVSTRDSNIALTEPVDLSTTDFEAFTDPSVRFSTVGGATDLTGFGIAPSIAAIPEPTAALFGSLLATALGLTVARRPQLRD